MIKANILLVEDDENLGFVTQDNLKLEGLRDFLIKLMTSFSDLPVFSKISSILKIPEKIISIKATSNEKIGFIGDGLGIAAESIVQITNEKPY